MSNRPTERNRRMCIFIDNNQLFRVQQQYDAACNEGRVRIDYEQLKHLLAGHKTEVDVHLYYSEFVNNDEPEEYDPDRQTNRSRIFQFLSEELGFMMTRLRLLQLKEGSDFEPGVDCEIVYSMVFLALQGHYGRFVLVSGNETLYRTVHRLRFEFGIPVDVAFFGSHCSARLKKSANVFVDLQNRPKVFRVIPYRNS